jgi:hypothetical protein
MVNNPLNDAHGEPDNQIDEREIVGIVDQAFFWVV